MNTEAPETQNGGGSGKDEIVKKAWKEFQDAFKEKCTTPLAPSARKQLRRIFELTVKDAIENGGKPWDDRCKRYPLGRVREIGILSQKLAHGGTVSELVLSSATDRVIAYWQTKCVARSTEDTGRTLSTEDASEFGARLVWCTAYMDAMKPVDGSDDKAC